MPLVQLLLKPCTFHVAMLCLFTVLSVKLQHEKEACEQERHTRAQCISSVTNGAYNFK
jgi:hypothetical protein